MFNYFSLASVLGFYTGSSIIAAASSTCKMNGRVVPCDQLFDSVMPFLVILGPILLVAVLLAITVGVLMAISWWKVFVKAGRPGWAAIIPFYNIVTILQIVGMSPWFVLLLLIPFFGQLALFVVMIFANIKLARAFGKEEGFAVGLILLPVVFVPILAFGKSVLTGIASSVPTVAPSAPVSIPAQPVTPTQPTNTEVPPAVPPTV